MGECDLPVVSDQLLFQHVQKFVRIGPKFDLKQEKFVNIGPKNWSETGKSRLSTTNFFAVHSA